jgi:hypothetical protein
MAFGNANNRRYRTLNPLNSSLIEIVLDDEHLRKIEKAGNVSLDSAQRLELRAILALFAFAQRGAFLDRGTKATKKHLDKFIQSVRQLHDSLQDSPTESADPSLITDGERLGWIYESAFYCADISLKDFISQLSRLESHTADLREGMSQGGRPRDGNVNSLLAQLAEIYKKAGGASIKVSRFNKKRTSKFIDFAWEAISHLPKLVKQPITKDALAARWEKGLALEGKLETQNISRV